MISLEQAGFLADQRLESHGFAIKDLSSQLEMVELNYVECQAGNIPYAVVGSPGAQNMLIEDTPYFTDLNKDHFLLRLATKQQALGPDWAVTGLQTYSPYSNRLSHAERKQTAKGEFSPHAGRFLRVAEKVIGLDQEAFINGYSKGADVAIQTVHDSLLSPNRGTVEFRALAAYEPARFALRGLKVVKDMGDSGKDFHKNVKASGSAALCEAFGIDAASEPEKTKKTFDIRTNAGIIKYVMRDVLGNLAHAQGFGTDSSLRQLTAILGQSSLPVLLGVQMNSTVTNFNETEALKLKFLNRQRFDLLIENGDHSADDNLRKSAARAIYFASFAA